MCFFRATVDEGDEVVVPSPYFVEYGNYCGHFGGVLKPVPTHVDFSLDVPAIAAAVTPKTRAILVNSPNNPTGAIYSKDELAALVDVVEHVNAERAKKGERPLFLLSDEPYRAFAYDGAEVPAILPLSKFALVLGSFSKTLSMAGERIGSNWVEKLSNVGSDGTDILVKAMVNIMLINVFKRKISRKFGDFKLHCMMDEIGKLHPNNVEGILKFANVRNINLINSSPTTYNAQAYKYTYSLSKDEKSNTVVKTLLTIR